MTARKPAKKRSQADKEQLPPGRDNDAEFTDEIGADIEDFFSDQDDRAIVMVYKVGKPGERDGFLDTLSITAIQTPSCQQVIRDTYGAGNFRLMMKAPDNRGRMRMAGSKTITIAEKPASITSGNGHAPGPNDYWRDESNKQQQLILALIGAQKPQQLDLAGLASILAVLTGGNKQSDLGAVVAAFTSLKAAAEPADTVSQIQKALDLARSLNGGAPAAGAGAEETDTSWPGIIKGAISAFTGAMQPAPRQLPAGQPGGNGADDEPDEVEEEAMLQQWLVGQLRFLKSKAQGGKPVEFWIQYTVENAEEPGGQALFGALKAGATFEHLLAFDPEIAQNPQLRLWFSKFYDGLKRSLPPPAAIPWIVRNSTDPTDNAPAGDTGQPAASGAPGGGNPGKP